MVSRETFGDFRGIAHATFFQPTMFGAELWTHAKEIVEVLRPIFLVLCLEDCEGCTLGLIYEFMDHVSEAIHTSALAEDMYDSSMSSLLFLTQFCCVSFMLRCTIIVISLLQEGRDLADMGGQMGLLPPTHPRRSPHVAPLVVLYQGFGRSGVVSGMDGLHGARMARIKSCTGDGWITRSAYGPDQLCVRNRLVV
ncbi:hypothetical protein O6H91_18G079500 [Diphasiastrum complanatum]|uniref:Uncharacterized protein n=1 Tax=Diphasiastrum complanatum TaxID=34168 RepID=A0ACC2B306_DIPCM|nr:hypothetical protein O6H91_18G079500 [Diphasiastrum complanatum]